MHINEAQAFLSSRSCLGTFWRKCCQCSGGLWHWLSTHGGPQRNTLTRRLVHSFLRMPFWAFKRASYRRSMSGPPTNTNVLILFMDLVSHDYLSAMTMLILLTHCGLLTSYGDRDLGQHWLRKWLVAWRHQTITWTNFDLSSVRSNGIHLRAIS